MQKKTQKRNNNKNKRQPEIS